MTYKAAGKRLTKARDQYPNQEQTQSSSTIPNTVVTSPPTIPVSDLLSVDESTLTVREQAILDHCKWETEHWKVKAE